jgi:tetratricopeptide (TPR) repeat protein
VAIAGNATAVRRAALLAATTSVAWVLAGAAGCARRAPVPMPGPIASALLGLAAELGSPPGQIADAWARLAQIAVQVAERQRRTGGDPVAGLNAAIVEDLGFQREVDRAELRFMLLPSVLEGRRGSCLGLAALYLTVAELLGVPLDGVLVPGHFFVRAPGPWPRNLELLRRGEVMPDEWYRRKYGPWPETATTTATPPATSPSAPSAYGRPVSVIELVAVHWFNVGNLRRTAGDLAGAERAYARAAGGFPSFAEAQASLGVVRQLRGRLTDAATAYRAAARARPDLPGLAQNMALLDAERTGQSLPTPRATNSRQRDSRESNSIVVPSIQ